MFWKKYDFETVRYAFITTIPVLLGYLAIGLAFGLMLINAGYPWILAPVMSILIYAGAGQYIAVGLFARNAGFLEMATVIFFVNARHMVYGLSLINKFKNTGAYKMYLMFALTDETYALLTTVREKEGVDGRKFYFLVSLFDQIYWITGSVLGALAGKIFAFNTKGIDFALTALFVVLLIEQFVNHRNKLPFVIAALCGIISLFLAGAGNMLVISIVSSIAILILSKRMLKNDES
jgi:4-azaleucine resistance transporter AzlC